MFKLPPPLKKIVDVLSELPSIGPRQAVRLGFYLVSRGQGHIKNFADALRDLGKIKVCERCFFVHENKGNLCDICADQTRRPDVILIVEKETDLISLEKTGKYKGRYFIIGPISKLGVLDDWQKLRLKNLLSFIERELGGKAEELILGFNPTSLGDVSAKLIMKELAPRAKKMSRLGRGLPTGGEIEFADDETLGSAIDRRS